MTACASRRFNSDAQTKVVGGIFADRGEFPFVAMLNRGCGAARVAKRTYLTAGHCVVSSNHKDVLEDGSIGGDFAKGSTVVLKSESVNVEIARTSFTIANVRAHPSYIEHVRTLRKTRILGPAVIDLALIDVVEDPSDDHIARLSFDSFTGTDGSLVLLGFGCDSFSDRITMTFRLKKGVITNFTPRKAMWLFEDNESSVCAGDSGAPLVWKANGKTFVVGVNSFGLAAGGTASHPGQGPKSYAVSFSKTEGGGEAARWVTEQLGL